MNASDDLSEPLGEAPDVPPVSAAKRMQGRAAVPPRSAVAALLDNAEKIARQKHAIAEVRALISPITHEMECDCACTCIACRTVAILDKWEV